MKKIAILCCLNANDVCAGVGCLNSFNGKDKAFACWAGQEVKLGAFLRCSHCGVPPTEDEGMIEKLERLCREGVEAVHVGICAYQKDAGAVCPHMAESARWLEERGIRVLWGTHSFFPGQ